jgi:hypothetical protein
VSTLEGAVKSKVKKLLKEYGAYWHCPVQNGMGSPTLDFVGCHYGDFYSIETKAEGKHPTPRQLLTMEEMRSSGAAVFVVAGDNGMLELENWLNYKKLENTFGVSDG